MGSKVISRNRGWYHFSLAGKLLSLPTEEQMAQEGPF